MIRSRSERRQGALYQLEKQGDCWLATASQDGHPHLIPISYYWDGVTLTIATWAESVTSRNVRQTGRARVSLPSTDDVVLIDASVQVSDPQSMPEELANAFKAAAGFDPRRSRDPFVVLTLTPTRVLAWRDEKELTGRALMRNGVWLDE